MISSKIDEILSRYKSGKKEDLIPILQEIQDSKGFLSEEAVVKVGRLLGLSTTKIYGLATFYDQFRFVPFGRIHIRICNGTTCFLNGSQSVINKIRDEIGIEPGQTTRDGFFSYEITSCMGGCNNGPVICINGEYRTNIRLEQVPDLIRKIRYISEND
jgi:NADH-quinone oxidoreductase subunit E